MNVYVDNIAEQAFALCDKLGITKPSHREMFAGGYREGIKVNPWHKVSDELPKVDKYRKCIEVFARKGDDVFVAFYSPVAGFSLTSSFFVEYALFDIEYWMPIPELPKEED